MQPASGVRVDGGEQTQHRFHALLICLDFQFFTHTGGRAGGKVVTADQCIHIKTGSACNNGGFSTAEDILQDGFVTLFTRLDSYKGEGSFEGWARKIFVTTALMYLRKKDALKMSDELEAARGLKTDTTSQIAEIGYKELMEIITSLPTGFRTVFNMYAVEGYSHKEIADILGISEVTSRSQFSRARAMLQKKIKERENV
jgi:RNA polymerase sigma-70 factor (ECF subfamily)